MTVLSLVWEGRHIDDVFGQWHVRSLRCYEVGLELRGLDVSTVRHPLAHDPDRAVLVEFLAASVCHSTNWDRLRNHLIDSAVGSPDFVAPQLAAMSLDTFVAQFSMAFGEVDDLP